MEFTPVEVSRYYSIRVPDHSKHRPVAGQWRTKCPVHSGKDPNFSISPETGMAFCHSQCGRGFDMVSLEMELSGLSFGKAKEAVFELICRPKPSPVDRDIDQIFVYTDVAGNPAYRVVRKYKDTGKKDFPQQAADGKGGWLLSLNGAEPLPYRLPEVAKAQLVFMAEGEKCVEALRYLKLTGSCNSGGAGKFKPELAQHFAGKDIGVTFDNDEPGRKHALQVARILKPVAKSVRIVEISGLPEKGDIADFVAQGRTAAELMDLYSAAPEWTPEFEFRQPHENDKYLRSLPGRIAEVGGFRNWLGELAKTGVPTPYQKITRALTGMRNGEFYVLAANQGTGKTSMALQFVINLLLQGKGVFVFSMEMSHDACFQRMLGIDARVNLWQYSNMARDGIRNDWIRQAEAALYESSKKFDNELLQVTTKPSVTPEMVILESRRVAKRAKVDFVAIDHSQLMSSTGKERTDYEKFTAISRMMKQVAVELNVPLLVISQTSRRNAYEKRTELDVSDIRGSGAWEEDAAGILLLYPDTEDLAAAKAEGNERASCGPVKSWLKVGKARYGIENVYQELLHFKSFTRFDVPEETPKH
jgi:KaiC/GvpD/RAD55 family RecA-like ATPase